MYHMCHHAMTHDLRHDATDMMAHVTIETLYKVVSFTTLCHASYVSNAITSVVPSPSRPYIMCHV